jgi:hypothetical protein
VEEEVLSLVGHSEEESGGGDAGTDLNEEDIVQVFSISIR